MSVDGWALATAAEYKKLVSVVENVLLANGYQRARGKERGSLWIQMRTHDHGTSLFIGNEAPNLALARTITEALGTPTQYLELQLQSDSVCGARVELPGGASEDVGADALEILDVFADGEDVEFDDEWYVDLAEALFDIELKKKKRKFVELAFRSAASPRVAGLLRAIRAGGTWERTTIANQPAIRVKGPTGSQISVLTPAEEAELVAAIDRYS